MRDYPGLDPFLIPNTGSLAQNEDGGSFLPVSLCLKWYHFSNGKKKKKKNKNKTKHNSGFLESKKAIKQAHKHSSDLHGHDHHVHTFFGPHVKRAHYKNST